MQFFWNGPYFDPPGLAHPEDDRATPVPGPAARSGQTNRGPGRTNRNQRASNKRLPDRGKSFSIIAQRTAVGSGVKPTVVNQPRGSPCRGRPTRGSPRTGLPGRSGSRRANRAPSHGHALVAFEPVVQRNLMTVQPDQAVGGPHPGGRLGRPIGESTETFVTAQLDRERDGSLGPDQWSNRRSLPPTAAVAGASPARPSSPARTLSVCQGAI